MEISIDEFVKKLDVAVQKKCPNWFIGYYSRYFVGSQFDPEITVIFKNEAMYDLTHQTTIYGKGGAFIDCDSELEEIASEVCRSLEKLEKEANRFAIRTGKDFWSGYLGL